MTELEKAIAKMAEVKEMLLKRGMTLNSMYMPYIGNSAVFNVTAEAEARSAIERAKR